MSTQIKFTPEHHAALGKKGTGKSTLMRYLVDKIQRDNPSVEAIWCNWTCLQFKGTIHRIRYLRQLRNAGFPPKSGRYGIVAIDELSKAIPSRKVGHHNVELYNLIQEVMNRLRKRNCYFIYTDQWRRGADIMVRTNVDYVELPTLTKTDTNEKHGETPLFYYVIEPKGTEFSEMEDLQKNATLMHTEMNVSELFPKFITEEVIPLTYNPPFKVEQWSKSFMVWCAKHNYILQGMNASTVRNILDLYQIKKNAYITAREISAVLGKLKVDGMI